jgi:predicted PurR-regulated permease PerM
MPKNSNFTFNRQYLVVSAYVVVTSIILFISYQLILHFGSVVAAITGFFANLLSALSPVIIGLVIAYLLGPLVKVIDRRIMGRLFYKIPTDPQKALKREKHLHTLSILVTFLIIISVFCLIVYTLAVLIVGQLVFTSLGQMTQSIVDYFLKYEQILHDLISQVPGSGLEQKLQEVVVSLAAWLSGHFSTTSIISFIFDIGGGILNVFLGAIVSIYFLLDASFFKRLWSKMLSLTLSEPRIVQVTSTLAEINVVIGQFLRGQLLDGLIIAILSSIGLTAVGLDFAVFIGFFAGLANIIPYFGPILGMIPAVIVALMTEGFSQALLAVLVLFVIQQIDSTIISPRVVGASTGLHPVFVLAAVIFAGYFWAFRACCLPSRPPPF